jgi:hypothetical protein
MKSEYFTGGSPSIYPGKNVGCERSRQETHPVFLALLATFHR